MSERSMYMRMLRNILAVTALCTDVKDVGVLASGIQNYDYIEENRIKYGKEQEELLLKDGRNGSDYRGFQTKTRTGKTCLNWTDQKYQSSAAKIARTLAEKQENGMDNHNFCRNFNDADTIWCYVKQGEGLNGSNYDYCYPDYHGFKTDNFDIVSKIDKTETGKTCLPWNSQKVNLANQQLAIKKEEGLGSHNFCRNHNDDHKPWCYVKSDSVLLSWDYCDPLEEATKIIVQRAEIFAFNRGLDTAHPRWAFASDDYSTKGLYAYNSGPYKGYAFYGKGGNSEERNATPAPPKYRPAKIAWNPAEQAVLAAPLSAAPLSAAPLSAAPSSTAPRSQPSDATQKKDDEMLRLDHLEKTIYVLIAIVALLLLLVPIAVVGYHLFGRSKPTEEKPTIDSLKRACADMKCAGQITKMDVEMGSR